MTIPFLSLLQRRKAEKARQLDPEIKPIMDELSAMVRKKPVLYGPCLLQRNGDKCMEYG